MSAPTDRLHDSNSLSFYAPRGGRAIRLAEVSEAAAALVPETSRDNDIALVPGDMSETDPAVARLRMRGSLDPELLPAPPMSLRRRSWMGSIVGFGLIVAAAVVAAFVAVGELPLGAMLGRETSLRSVELASSAARPAQPIAAPQEEPVSQLAVQNLRGRKGEPAPLSATLKGRAGDGAVVMVTGLVPGMTLSTGGAVGADGWQVPAADLGNTWVVPPKDFVGTADVVVELRLGDDATAQRRTIRLEWAGPQTTVKPARQLGRDEIAALRKRGRDYIAAGDFAAARLVLQFAAEAHDAEAALALAATYDPSVLRERKAYGITGDIEQARAWYEKAQQYGSSDAQRRLGILASGTR
jgi:hypothetical protein